MINMDSHQFQIRIMAVIRCIKISQRKILSDNLIMTILTLVIFSKLLIFCKFCPFDKAMARKTGKV